MKITTTEEAFYRLTIVISMLQKHGHPELVDHLNDIKEFLGRGIL